MGDTDIVAGINDDDEEEEGIKEIENEIKEQVDN